jgi:hypothetical protein
MPQLDKYIFVDQIIILICVIIFFYFFTKRFILPKIFFILKIRIFFFLKEYLCCLKFIYIFNNIKYMVNIFNINLLLNYEFFLKKIIYAYDSNILNKNLFNLIITNKFIEKK